jgi:sulfur carrier protein ThiS
MSTSGEDESFSDLNDTLVNLEIQQDPIVVAAEGSIVEASNNKLR